MKRPNLEAVRTEILRRYYEESFGEDSSPLSAYAGATADEYVELKRIVSPGSSARDLLTNSPEVLGLRLAADAAPDDRVLIHPEPLANPRWERVASDLVDLADDSLTGRRVWLKRSRVSLSGAPTPSWFWLSQCGVANRLSAKRFEAPLELVQLTECDAECDSLVLGHLSARVLVWQPRVRPVSVAALAAWTELDYLRVDAPIIRDFGRLAPLRLEKAVIVRVGTGDELREGLRGSWSTLRRLMVATVEPLRPVHVEAFTHLEQLRIPAIPALRDEWIAWALKHRDVACVFSSPGTFAAMTGSAAIERYREVYVFQDPGGRAPRNRIEHDFVDELDLEFDDNGDLEDELRKRAKKAKLKLKWGSEASTLVATSTSLDEIHWVIDTCHAHRRAPGSA